MKRISIIFGILLVLICGSAEARVFNFKNEFFAAYFRGSLGLSRLDREAYEGGSGAATVFVGDENKYNFSGELGFLFNMGDVMTMRIGGEVLQSKESELVGNNTSGTKLFDLETDVFVFTPMATLEYHLMTNDTTRFSIFAGAGASTVALDNKYTFTAPGLTELSVAADYTEKSDALLISAHYGVQFEYLLVDSVTMTLEAAFRHMPIPEVEHKHDTATINGNVTKGSAVLNDDGSNRNLDLSGFFIGLSFRFYIAGI